LNQYLASKHKGIPLNQGKIISVRGSVVDVCFESNLPTVYTLLHTGKVNEISIEVLAQLDVHHIRGIALTPTQGLARGMLVKTDGRQLTVPVGKSIIGRMFDVFGNTIDKNKPLSTELERRNIHPLLVVWTSNDVLGRLYLRS